MKKYFNHLATFVATIILFAGAPMLYAWTSPSARPPLANTSAPINISDKSQNKIGALGLGGLAVFGKTLLTETNDYALPSSAKPSMLLGVNGAVGAKEYCDERGQNCVSTLAGGVVSKSSGTSWENVPLVGGENFDIMCEYRFKIVFANEYTYIGSDAMFYANGVTKNAIVYISHLSSISHINSDSKTGYRVNNRPPVYTVTKIERRC